MGGSPTPFVNAFDHPMVNSLRYNTAQYGSAIFVPFGCVRVSVNIIEGYGFSGHAQGKGGASGGAAKGGVTNKSKKSGNYQVFVAMAICSGVVSVTGAPLSIGGKNRVWSNGGIAAFDARLGLNFFSGTDGQAQDPNFDTIANPNVPHVNYSGTAYVTGDPLQLGGTPALPNISFEITGLEVGTVGPNFPGDANPSSILSDIITNGEWGCNLPSSIIDSAHLSDFATYCQAGQLAMSMLLDKQMPGSQWLDEVAILTSMAICCSSQSIKFIPFFGGSLANNGTTWTPTLTAQYNLGDDDLIPWAAENLGSLGVDETTPETPHLQITRKDPAEVTNWLSFEYMNSANSYNPDTVVAMHQGAIDAYGMLDEASIQAHQFTNAISARAAIDFMLLRKQQSRNTYKFQTTWHQMLLEIGDIVTLTDSGQGLAVQPVRIMSMEEGSEGQLIWEAEEYPVPQGGIPGISIQIGAGALVVDPYADPGNVNAPVIFEPPHQLTGDQLTLWIVATGGPHWGGCVVYVSFDGSTYNAVGNIFAGAIQGAVSGGTFPSHTDPDTVDTLQVDLTESSGRLLGGTASDADNFVTLSYVGGELISYQTSTLVSGFIYNLGTRIRRGAYGTPISSHAVAAPFARVGPTDPTTFKYTYPSQYVGSTVFLKFASFNTLGAQLQDISLLTPVSYTLTGGGVAPAQYQVTGNFAGLPTAAQIIFRYVFAISTIFNTNLPSSVFVAGVAATASAAFSIRKNGVAAFTATFGVGATTATFSGAATTFSPGDVLDIVAPGPADATLANLSWNFQGHG